MSNPPVPETNGQVIEKLMASMGVEEVDGFTFELPSGAKVRIESEDDPFFNEPFQPGTKVTAFTSAEAGAPVKMRGDYWLVHQNDPDQNWPSDFHAHNKVRPETLDCYTGKIYDPRTRKLIRQYSRKHLDYLLSQLPNRTKP